MGCGASSAKVTVEPEIKPNVSDTQRIQQAESVCPITTDVHGEEFLKNEESHAEILTREDLQNGESAEDETKEMTEVIVPVEPTKEEEEEEEQVVVPYQPSEETATSTSESPQVESTVEEEKEEEEEEEAQKVEEEIPEPPPPGFWFEIDNSIIQKDDEGQKNTSLVPIYIILRTPLAKYQRFRTFVSKRGASGLELLSNIQRAVGVDATQVTVYLGQRKIKSSDVLECIKGFGTGCNLFVEITDLNPEDHHDIKCTSHPLKSIIEFARSLGLPDGSQTAVAKKDFNHYADKISSRGSSSTALSIEDFTHLIECKGTEPSGAPESGTFGFPRRDPNTREKTGAQSVDNKITEETLRELLGANSDGIVNETFDQGKVALNAKDFPTTVEWNRKQAKVTRRLVEERVKAGWFDKKSFGGGTKPDNITARVQAERQAAVLNSDFIATAKYCVELIVENKVTPVKTEFPLFPTTPPSTQLYIVGGMILRRVGNWVLEGQSMTSGDIGIRLASLELASMKHTQELLQQKPDVELQIPASCIVDHLGQRFIAHALFPLDLLNIRTGSIDDGFSAFNCLGEKTKKYAKKLGKLLNIAAHHVLPFKEMSQTTSLPDVLGVKKWESVPNATMDAPVNKKHPLVIETPLTLRTLVVKNKLPEEVDKFVRGKPPYAYVFNTVTASPPDLTYELESFFIQGNLASRAEALGTFLLPPSCASWAENTENEESKALRATLRLRPELVDQYSISGETKSKYKYYTSLHPRTCNNCHNIITDFEFYEYDTSQKSFLQHREDLMKKYNLCLSCVEGNSKDSFEVPFSRMRKAIVPLRDRLEYWKDSSGKLKFINPIVRTPLNPEALVFPRPTKDVVASLNKAGERQDQMNAPGILIDNDRDLLHCASSELQFRIIPLLIQDLDELMFIPDTPKDLVDEMHRRGINVRYLGRISKEARQNYVKEMAIREMFSRSIKVIVRDALSFISPPDAKGEGSVDWEEEAKRTIVNLLNVFFGKDREEEEEWQSISEISFSKFGVRVTYSVRDYLFLPGVARDVSRILGVRIDQDFSWDFSGTDPFSPCDIHDIHPVARSILSEGTLLEVRRLLEAAVNLDGKGAPVRWYTRGGPERADATEMYRKALSVAENIYGVTSLEVAECKFRLASQLKQRHEERGAPESSRWNRSASIPPSAFSIEAERLFREALIVREKGLAVGVVSPLDLAAIYSELSGLIWKIVSAAYIEDGTAEELNGESTALLLQAVLLVEASVGYHHPTTAQFYVMMANHYLELGNCSKASPLIRRAFLTNLDVFGKDHPILVETYHLLQQIETSVDSGLDTVPIDELVSRLSNIGV